METMTEKDYLQSLADAKNLIVNKTDSKLREMVIEYVGEKTNPDNDEITVEDVVSVFAEEFPEFLLVIAKENFIKGYEEAVHESELARKA
tara:strand:+ start:1224 stop:1493 length:270 start_codon:yes stop_codon:yes gene_type:complete